jgi:hypothetical protein
MGLGVLPTSRGVDDNVHGTSYLTGELDAGKKLAELRIDLKTNRKGVVLVPQSVSRHW